jgi:hypothetical protein
VVEHDEHHLGMRRERTQEPLVDGSVGVLLRVEHPHQQVGPRHHALHLDVMSHLCGVVVRQIEEHQALQACRLASAAGVDLVAYVHAEPVQQLAGAVSGPGARERLRGRGSTHADAGMLGSREAVEQRRLAGTGSSSQRHNRVLAGQPQTFL